MKNHSLILFFSNGAKNKLSWNLATQIWALTKSHVRANFMCFGYLIIVYDSGNQTFVGDIHEIIKNFIAHSRLKMKK